MQKLLVIGVNHQSAPVALRESLAPLNGQLPEMGRHLLTIDGVDEAVVLSTCNRVELVTCCSLANEVPADLESALFRRSGLDVAEYRECLFHLEGREAVRHVFRVAASLDSMVVGEPQILGQLKEQFAAAAEAKVCGPILHRVFHKSFSVAKRVRSETAVASKAVSVASIATELAERIFESLDGRTVLLLGVGEMGELTARHLTAAGASRIMVANRTFDRAVESAREFGGTPVPIERVAGYLPLVDLVVGASGGGQIFTADQIAEAMRARQRRPMFFIDLAVPRNFDEGINRLQEVYLYNIDDLSAVADENHEERKREAVRGEAIVEDEVERFWQWLEQLEVVPTLNQLREYAERIRAEELNRTLRKLEGVSDDDRERVEKMTHAIVNKLLHRPTTVLKNPTDPSRERGLLGALHELFGLGRDR